MNKDVIRWLSCVELETKLMTTEDPVLSHASELFIISAMILYKPGISKVFYPGATWLTACGSVGH